MSTALMSSFYDGSHNDVFSSINVMGHDTFSPTTTTTTNAFPSMMTFDKRLIGTSIGIEELQEFKKHNSAPNIPLMRSMSCNANSVLPLAGSDSVFNNSGGGGSNVFDNAGKENRPRDRAFSESDRNQRNAQNSNRYKTELCRPFMENGKCKYGDKCQFAHGEHEIRNLQRHPKYKTELCRTYHTVGICPYGPRCHFIHNPVERKHYNTSPKQRRERTVERPRLLPFSSVPMGSTGDLTPPPSVCDSPSPFSPYALSDSAEDQPGLLEALKAQARELATGEQSDLLVSPRGMSPTLQSPITSAPGSPFSSGHGYTTNNNNHHHQHNVQLKDDVFFSNSKPSSPNAYRPPSPPDSDPESYCCDRSTSPTTTAGPAGRSSRLPIFRVMSMEEYR